MKLTKTTLKLDLYPEEIRKFIEGSPIYDSSSSPEARVLFIDKEDGYFLKSAEKGSLSYEAVMGEYFHKKGLAPEILLYTSEKNDFLLTKKAKGLDATDKIYLDEPKRLATKMGEVLRELHSLDFSDCPLKDRMARYFALAEENARLNKYDLSFGNFPTKEEALRAVEDGKKVLKQDTLIHGDFCLPNIIFDSWQFSSFIDLGVGGAGDRHIDIFWGAWTLNFNLKTDAYKDIFFSAYGKENIEAEALRAVSACEVFG